MIKQYKGEDFTKVNLTTWDIMRESSNTSRAKTFLVFVPSGSTCTFGQFEEKVNKLSNLLIQECAIRQGDKVCTMSENFPELLYAIMAITNIGALWVPLNNMLVGESLKYVIEASNARHVFVCKRYSESINEVLLNVKQPVQVLPILESIEKADDRSSEFESPAKPDDLSMIIFTSGTTGLPKGVIHTHNSGVKMGIRAMETLAADSNDRIHMVLPFFHGWAYSIMLGALYSKCQMIVEDRFHVDTYWETVEKYKITQDHWTGTIPINLMKLPKCELEQKKNLRIFGTFGSLYEVMKERWPNMSFQSLYGQTEHAGMTTVPTDEIRPDSDGIPKYPDEIMILDDNGSPLPTGETGEIVCRCNCGILMKGYYNDPEATAKTLRGNDLYTGDLGYLDAEGHLHFVGRKKDALRVRGEMVSMEYVENLINKHPKIAESAAVGYRSSEKEALKEDEIVAHLVLREGEMLNPAEFQKWAEINLPRFMRPKYAVFHDVLPKSATARIQRFKLKEEGIKGAIKLY